MWNYEFNELRKQNFNWKSGNTFWQWDSTDCVMACLIKFEMLNHLEHLKPDQTAMKMYSKEHLQQSKFSFTKDIY